MFEWKCLYFSFFLWHVFNFKLVHAKHTLTHKLYRFGFWIASLTLLFVWCHFFLNWCVRPDWTINRLKILLFFQWENKQKIQIDKICAPLTHLYVWTYINVYVRWEYYSFIPPPSLVRSLTMRYRWLWFFFSLAISNEWFDNKWRMGQEDSNSNKQQTTHEIRSKSINVVYQYTNIQTSEGKERKLRNKYRAQFFELLL